MAARGGLLSGDDTVVGAQGEFGDGSNDNVTISGTTNLTSSMFYKNLTIANGGVLHTKGFIVFVSETCDVQAGGKIHCNGGDASGSTGGVAPTAGTALNYYCTGTGGNGGTTGAGSNGTGYGSSTLMPLGSAGGAGGAGSGGAGGTAGVLTTTAQYQKPRASGVAQIAANSWWAYGGGSGGGGGGGSAGGNGGGGGANGGVVDLRARRIINNGAIEAKGGAGANGVAGNGGGGGGGGGGCVILTTRGFSGTAPDVSGGLKGNGVGTGSNGSDGTAGLVIMRQG